MDPCREPDPRLNLQVSEPELKDDIDGVALHWTTRLQVQGDFEAVYAQLIECFVVVAGVKEAHRLVTMAPEHFQEWPVQYDQGIGPAEV